jgi:hypothetical protein
MATETVAILRSLLFSAMQAETVDEVVNAISVMCSKDDIAAVKEQVAIAAMQKKEKQMREGK